MITPIIISMIGNAHNYRQDPAHTSASHIIPNPDSTNVFVERLEDFIFFNHIIMR